MAKINIELANGQKAGETLKQLTNQAAALRKEVGGLKPGTEEFIKSAASLNQVEGKMGDVKKEIKNTTDASNSLKGQFGGILNQIPGFSQLSGALSAARVGVGGLTTSFWGLSAAIIATGIGAIVVAIALGIGAIYAAIKTDDETADLFGKRWGQITAIFDVLLERLGRFGKGIVSILSGDFKKGFGEMKNSVSGVGDQLQRAVELSGQLADKQNQLEDETNQFKAAEQGLKNTIDELILQSKDRTKTEAERIALQTKAEGLLQKQTNDRMSLTRRQSDIDIEAIGMKHDIQRQLNETTQTYGMRLLENSKIGGDEATKLSDSIRAVDEAQAESLKTLEKLQNQRNALIDKQEERRIKLLEAAKKTDQDQSKVVQEQENRANKNNEFLEETQEAKATAKAKISMTALLTHLQKKTEAYKKDSEEFRLIEEGKRAIEAETLATFNEGANSTIALLGATSEARKKNANAIKTLQTGQVLVNGIMEISEIAKTFAALGPFGQVLAAFRIGFSAARTAAAVQAIQAQKFERGGVFKGPSHAQGGIQVEVEGDELFMAKGVYRDPYLRNMASQINVAGGGRSFAAGGPTNPFDNSRGAMPSANAGGMFDYDKMAAAMDKRIDSKIATIRVVNNLQDTSKGLNVLNKLVNEANV